MRDASRPRATRVRHAGGGTGGGRGGGGGALGGEWAATPPLSRARRGAEEPDRCGPVPSRQSPSTLAHTHLSLTRPHRKKPTLTATLTLNHPSPYRPQATPASTVVTDVDEQAPQRSPLTPTAQSSGAGISAPSPRSSRRRWRMRAPGSSLHRPSSRAGSSRARGSALGSGPAQSHLRTVSPATVLQGRRRPRRRRTVMTSLTRSASGRRSSHR